MTKTPLRYVKFAPLRVPLRSADYTKRFGLVIPHVMAEVPEILYAGVRDRDSNADHLSTAWKFFYFPITIDSD